MNWPPEWLDIAWKERQREEEWECGVEMNVLSLFPLNIGSAICETVSITTLPKLWRDTPASSGQGRCINNWIEWTRQCHTSASQKHAGTSQLQFTSGENGDAWLPQVEVNKDIELAWGSVHTDIRRVVFWAMAYACSRPLGLALSGAAAIDQESVFQNSTLLVITWLIHFVWLLTMSQTRDRRLQHTQTHTWSNSLLCVYWPWKSVALVESQGSE